MNNHLHPVFAGILNNFAGGSMKLEFLPDTPPIIEPQSKIMLNGREVGTVGFRPDIVASKPYYAYIYASGFPVIGTGLDRSEAMLAAIENGEKAASGLLECMAELRQALNQ